MSEPKSGDLRVWHIPQIPGKPFHVAVQSLAEAKLVLNALAQYDLFQFDNHIKPDYANAQGLEIAEPEAFRLAWFEWCNDITGDDIHLHEL
jgi:hypothetical protein